MFLPQNVKLLNKHIKRRGVHCSWRLPCTIIYVVGMAVVEHKCNFEQAIEEARRIIKSAEERGIVLRTIGAVAFRIHCPKSSDLYSTLKRELTDIDFVAEQKHASKIDKLFADLGWELKFGRLMYYDRKIYENRASKLKADVFFDKLRMNHTIDLRSRLSIDHLTISVADLFLEKMQIVKINEKDVKDSIVLLREHEVGDGDKEILNIRYAANLLGQDWGLYYTVTENLKKVKYFLNTYPYLAEQGKADVTSKIEKILRAVEDEPKSLGWKMRAKVGAKKKWYTEVGELNL